MWLIDAGVGPGRRRAVARACRRAVRLPAADRTAPFPYRLRLEVGGGNTVEIDDPYRFPPVLGELDAYLIAEGNHLRLYEKLGAHPMELEGVAGVAFLVWAPNATRVSVVGDFNGWDGRRHPDAQARGVRRLGAVRARDRPRARSTSTRSRAPHGELLPLKADPLAFAAEQPPRTASVVHGLGEPAWSDARG